MIHPFPTGGGTGSGPASPSGIDVLVVRNGTATLAGGLVVSVSSTNPTHFGNNTITGGPGQNTIIGGPGSNHLTGAGASDVIVGADATASFSNGVITSIATMDVSSGGTDTITGGPGKEVILGGAVQSRSRAATATISSSDTTAA